VIKKSRKRGG